MQTIIKRYVCISAHTTFSSEVTKSKIFRSVVNTVIFYDPRRRVNKGDNHKHFRISHLFVAALLSNIRLEISNGTDDSIRPAREGCRKPILFPFGNQPKNWEWKCFNKQTELWLLLARMEGNVSQNKAASVRWPGNRCICWPSCRILCRARRTISISTDTKHGQY